LLLRPDAFKVHGETPTTAIDGLFDALVVCAPDVLEKLRDCPDDARVVLWARKFRLESDLVLHCACQLRRHCAKYPHHGQRLLCNAWISLGASYNPTDREWTVRVRANPLAFLPREHEAEAEWLARAKQLYLERVTRKRRARPVQRLYENFRRRCERFVEVQVLRVPKATVARRTDVDRPQLIRETKQIANLLGI
jgi:hypothetical protein